ncbi:energy-coupling factor ABC transporter ATP-binding protein [Candidatus Micrarchaeota archaeon]|nr:energy-coupling factor ABC transporter ATP-binding protein [Candidatus Micrarchaeota archaeon]
MPLLSFEQFSLRFGSQLVLNEISLSIEKGEFIGLMGGIGSGKTSFLLSINGVIPKLVPAQTQGRVMLSGKEVSKHSVQSLSRDVAMVFQNPSDQLFSLTVEDEVAFGLRNQHLPQNVITERVTHALNDVGLSAFTARDPSSLSHGQKQKVAIASALALQTPLIVLDEPTSNLDFSSSVALYTLLEKLHADGNSILVVDHDTDLLSRYAKRFIVLYGQRVIADGDPSVFINGAAERAGLKVPCRMRGE